MCELQKVAWAPLPCILLYSAQPAHIQKAQGRTKPAPAAGLRAAAAAVAGIRAAGPSGRGRICAARHRPGPVAEAQAWGRIKSSRPSALSLCTCTFGRPRGTRDAAPAARQRGAASELERERGTAGLAGAGPVGTLRLLPLSHRCEACATESAVLLPRHHGRGQNGPMAGHRTMWRRQEEALLGKGQPRREFSAAVLHTSSGAGNGLSNMFRRFPCSCASLSAEALRRLGQGERGASVAVRLYSADQGPAAKGAKRKSEPMTRGQTRFCHLTGSRGTRGGLTWSALFIADWIDSLCLCLGEHRDGSAFTYGRPSNS